ncbi:hypothetical protein GCM10018785_07790 [Streptomyces longispororuber]|uniref:Uncharacterized protein n=1 Tax=Streptomyces longispororuber TaxID=68230 RepID=A0A918Z7M8_9ACTN|nr:hypothetical protein [Streptomyces longispororuber]GHE40723.1 hypothetical protein GCM10018785_07790 [Streptomyces longispororuber]
MKPPTTDRPDRRPGRGDRRPDPAPRARHWAVTTLVVLLSLLCGGMAPAAAAPGPAATPATPVAPLTPVVPVTPGLGPAEAPPPTADTRERTARDGEVHHPPCHFARAHDSRTSSAYGRRGRDRAHSPAPHARTGTDTAPGPAGPERALRTGVQLLLLYCVARS